MIHAKGVLEVGPVSSRGPSVFGCVISRSIPGPGSPGPGIPPDMTQTFLIRLMMPCGLPTHSRTRISSLPSRSPPSFPVITNSTLPSSRSRSRSCPAPVYDQSHHGCYRQPRRQAGALGTKSRRSPSRRCQYLPGSACSPSANSPYVTVRQLPCSQGMCAEFIPPIHHPWTAGPLTPQPNPRPYSPMLFVGPL